MGAEVLNDTVEVGDTVAYPVRVGGTALGLQVGRIERIEKGRLSVRPIAGAEPFITASGKPRLRTVYRKDAVKLDTIRYDWGN